MQDYERVWIDHVKYLLKLAEDAIRDMDIADKEKTIETLVRQYIQMIKNVMNIADETQVKNLKKLKDAVDDAFKCGVVVGFYVGFYGPFELLKESEEWGKELLKEIEEWRKISYELIIKLLKENKVLREKLNELQKRMSKTSETIYYIR